jgi:hypothetical protein
MKVSLEDESIDKPGCKLEQHEQIVYLYSSFDVKQSLIQNDDAGEGQRTSTTAASCKFPISQIMLAVVRMEA